METIDKAEFLECLHAGRTAIQMNLGSLNIGAPGQMLVLDTRRLEMVIRSAIPFTRENGEELLGLMSRTASTMFLQGGDALVIQMTIENAWKIFVKSLTGQKMARQDYH